MRLLLAIYRFIGRWPALRQLVNRLINPAFLVGVVAVVLDDDGKVVLFHHTYRHRFPWSLPGGWLKRGEDPQAALAREIREESKLEIEILRPLIALTEQVYPNFETIYLARLTGGTFAPSYEVDRIGRFTADDLPPLRDYQRELILSILRETQP